MLSRRRFRPCLEGLESRLAPAWNLSISTAMTSMVSDVLDSGTRTFTAFRIGANVNVTDIKNALAAGENVVVATGNTGSEGGDIDWLPGAALDLTSGTGRMLQLSPDPSGTSRQITHQGGLLNIGANTLEIGDGAAGFTLGGSSSSTLAGTGGLNGSVVVSNLGAIAPGDVGTAGTLNVKGDIAFQDGGKLLVDIGVTSDLLSVAGSVSFPGGATLEGTGATPSASPIPLMTTSGALNGTFTGTTSGPFVLGFDFVTATYAVGGPGMLQVKRAVGPKTVILPTQSGDNARIRLLGGGSASLFAVDQDFDGIIDLVRVRNSTAKNTLEITGLPNGGPGTVRVAQVEIQGSIAAIRAPTTSLSGSGGDILTVSGKLGGLTARGLSNGDVTVASAGNVQAIGVFFVNFVSAGRVASLTINSIQELEFTATTLGSLRVKRFTPLGIRGDIFDSNLTLTGRFGPQLDGLTSAVIDGFVQNCIIKVLMGNVGSFTAGLFIDSRLYVGYTPPLSGNFNDLGTFDPVNYMIRSFKTTVIPNGIATPAFQDSEVVAAKLGTVRLSSVELDNGSTTFGLRVRPGPKNVGSVRIANTPQFDGMVDYKPSLTGEVIPSVGGLGEQGEFQFFV